MSVTEKIGLTTVTVEYVGRERDQDGGYRRAYTATITAPQWQYVDNTLRSGVAADVNERDLFGTLASFLLACVESREHATRTGGTGENADLFPDHVAEWAERVTYELEILQEDYS